MKPSKQAALDEDGSFKRRAGRHLQQVRGDYGFRYGAATITRLHAERGGRERGRVWMQLETARGKFEIHVSPSGLVRIWGEQDGTEGEWKPCEPKR